MRPVITIAALLLFSALGAMAQSKVGGEEALTQPQVEAASPAASLLPAGVIPSLPATTLRGKQVDLAAVPGYKAIYFFSLMCPCVRSCEQFSFKPLAKQYAGKVSFYAVASGAWDLKDDRANFLDLLATHHLPFPLVLDKTHAVADSLGGRAASQVVLLDPSNHVVYSGQSDDSKEILDKTGKLGVTKHFLADAIAESLAGKPVKLQYTAPRGCSIDR